MGARTDARSRHDGKTASKRAKHAPINTWRDGSLVVLPSVRSAPRPSLNPPIGERNDRPPMHGATGCPFYSASRTAFAIGPSFIVERSYTHYVRRIM